METKENKEPKKLSYDELKKTASEIHVAYQKLAAQYQKLANEHEEALKALDDKAFSQTSFFLSCLFKVLEHPEMYKNAEFVDWASENIESILRGFNSALTAEPEDKPKDEAE